MKKIIDKYIEYKRNIEKQIFKKLNIAVDVKDHDQQLRHLKEKIQQILKTGLDVGTIIKQVVKVEIVEYQDNFYFRDTKTGVLYRIDDNI